MTARLELDFWEYWQLYDRVVGVVFDWNHQNIMEHQVAAHGGRMIYPDWSIPMRVIIEFDSSQKLDMFVLRYM